MCPTLPKLVWSHPWPCWNFALLYTSPQRCIYDNELDGQLITVGNLWVSESCAFGDRGGPQFQTHPTWETIVWQFPAIPGALCAARDAVGVLSPTSRCCLHQASRGVSVRILSQQQVGQGIINFLVQHAAQIGRTMSSLCIDTVNNILK